MVTSCLVFVLRNHFDTAALTKITQEISDKLFWSLGTAVLWDRGNNNSYSALKFGNRERIGSSKQEKYENSGLKFINFTFFMTLLAGLKKKMISIITIILFIYA